VGAGVGSPALCFNPPILPPSLPPSPVRAGPSKGRGGAVPGGHAAVATFFYISGFLLAYLTVKDAERKGQRPPGGGKAPLPPIRTSQRPFDPRRFQSDREI